MSNSAVVALASKLRRTLLSQSVDDCDELSTAAARSFGTSDGAKPRMCACSSDLSSRRRAGHVAALTRRPEMTISTSGKVAFGEGPLSDILADIKARPQVVVYGGHTGTNCCEQCAVCLVLRGPCASVCVLRPPPQGRGGESIQKPMGVNSSSRQPPLQGGCRELGQGRLS